ncbi:amidohydrolase family protein [Lacibacter sp. MH-610]|uniref:amidohydrolase family protein n=1 Tax=Lacibacter sp. MH-610 TaxID=3020883 RepID=UPI0038913EEB
MRSFLSMCLLLIFLSSTAQKKALVGGTLIDGFGGDPLRNSVILISGTKIEKVGTIETLPVPAGYEVISTEGMSVLPGLWDMHVHLMINGHSDYPYWDKKYPPLFRNVIMPAGARQLLMAGVTSARDLGAPLEDIIAVRDSINKGRMIGPTLYVSGPFLQHAPYPGTEQFRWGVNGPADARAKVQRLAKGGVDCIKLIDQDQMTQEEVNAIVDEAHKWKLKVVAHSHRPEEIRRGMIAGVDCFEHTGLATAPEYPEDVMKMIKERTANSNTKLFWCPTVEGLFNNDYNIRNTEHLDDPSWQVGLPDSVVKDIRNSLAHPSQLSYFQVTPYRKPTLKRKFSQLKESGVILLIGTDSGIPMKFHSQSTWNELDIWVREMGVDPMLAIRSATYWPAVFHGVEDKVGTITEGKTADIIAVRGDVLRYINLLQKVDMVIKGGVRVK